MTSGRRNLSRRLSQATASMFVDVNLDPSASVILARRESTTSKETRQAIASGRNLLDLWRTRVSREQVKRCLQILGVFGLDQIYADDPRPHVAGALALMKRDEQCDMRDSSSSGTC
jgi:hypothetical protein